MSSIPTGVSDGQLPGGLAVENGYVLKAADVPVTVFGAKETTHTKINADFGKSDDPGTTALFAFVEKALK